MKTIRVSVLIIIAAIFVAVSAHAFADSGDDVLYQVSTIDALLDGVYAGDLSLDDLEEHGDIGLGTYNCLDGEMIFLDGVFYKIRVDGKVYEPDGNEKTPFAVVTSFETDNVYELGEFDSMDQLEGYIDTLLPSENIFYTIRIDGKFKYIKTRSVPQQEEPYPPLLKVVKDQAVFEFEDIKGAIVAFWSPDYAKGINVTGYHMHFISEDRTKGGHLLDCQVEEARMAIDDTSGFYMVLPDDEEFLTADLTGDKAKALNKAEKD